MPPMSPQPEANASPRVLTVELSATALQRGKCYLHSPMLPAGTVLDEGDELVLVDATTSNSYVAVVVEVRGAAPPGPGYAMYACELSGQVAPLPYLVQRDDQSVSTS